MALPADGVPVFSGRLHVFAVTISWGPFLPLFTAGLHQLFGRHCIETQTHISKFIPFSTDSVSAESHDCSAGRGERNIYHHRISSVRSCRNRLFELELNFLAELWIQTLVLVTKSWKYLVKSLFFFSDSLTLMLTGRETHCRRGKAP